MSRTTQSDGGRVLHVVGEALAAAGLDRQAVDVSRVERSHPARKTRLGGLQPLRIHSSAGLGGTHGHQRARWGTRGRKWDKVLSNFLGSPFASLGLK